LTQVNTVNLAVGEVTWLLYTEVTAVHILCMGCLWVAPHIPALSPVGLAVVAVSRQFESVPVSVLRPTTAPSSASFAEAKLTPIRRDAFAADEGKHRLASDSRAGQVVEVG